MVEWGILLTFFLLWSAILAVLAKAIREDIAGTEETTASKAGRRTA